MTETKKVRAFRYSFSVSADVMVLADSADAADEVVLRNTHLIWHRVSRDLPLITTPPQHTDHVDHAYEIAAQCSKCCVVADAGAKRGFRFMLIDDALETLDDSGEYDDD